jgi:uncharacterized membrane protein
VWNTFWNFLWSTIVIFAVIAYLMILFNILIDLFWRDRKASGIVKAIWVVGLVLLPYLIALVYLVFRGKGMAERAINQAVSEKQRAEDYIREVAGRSPTQEIAEAKQLLDNGSITDTEYQQLKARVLAH